MDMFQWFVLVALAATLFSLGSGVLAMLHDGEVAHGDSATWMTWRVAFQGFTVLLVLAASHGSH